MAKGDIAHDEQFPLMPQCFQLYLMIKLSFMEIFHILVNMFSKSSAAKLLYVVKGYNLTHTSNLQQTTWKTSALKDSINKSYSVIP